MKKKNFSKFKANKVSKNSESNKDRNHQIRLEFQSNPNRGNKGPYVKPASHGSDISGDRTYFNAPIKNDPQWYVLSDAIASATASLPARQMLGLPNQFSTNRSSVVSGVMVFPWIPSLGGIEMGSSYTASARAEFVAIRKENSGATNYEAPDLFMAHVAVISAYQQLLELKRVYGLLNAYISTNRYWPIGIVRALGYDYQSMIDHMPQLLSTINNLIRRLSVVKIPKGYYLMDRWAYLSDSVFMDNKNERSQAYVFRCVAPFQWFNTESTGSALKTQWIGHDEDPDAEIWTPIDLMSYEYAIHHITSMVNRILADVDIAVMSGDTAKAYGEGGLFYIEEVTKDYVVIPKDVDDIKYQIMNADHFGQFQAIARGTDNTVFRPISVVKQSSTGNITTYTAIPFGVEDDIQRDRMAEFCTYRTNYGRDVINLYDPSINTPENMLEFTRFKTPICKIESVADPDYPGGQGNGIIGINIRICGTEVILGACPLTLVYSDGHLESNLAGISLPAFYGVAEEYWDARELVGVVKGLAARSWFDWAPMVHYYDGVDEASAPPVCDLDSYYIVDHNVVRDMFLSSNLALLLHR